MDVLVILLALGILMFFAYRGFSVILLAPLSALLAIFLTDPSHVLPFFSNIFMEKMVGFIKLYFPVFLLGAIFGKVVEMTGIAEKITRLIVRVVGVKQAILAIVLMCVILTYSGVSLFVVVFAVYPFAAQLFREANVPKRLIPGAIALGAFSFSMDAIPGSPQIQNVIPTTFFKTDIYAAPTLGIIGAIFIFSLGMLYLERERRKAALAGEGYFGKGDVAREIQAAEEQLSTTNAEQANVSMSIGTVSLKDWLALLPLVLVGVTNKIFTISIPKWYANGFDFVAIGLKSYGTVDMKTVLAIWSVEMALLTGIICAIALNFSAVKVNFKAGLNVGISGALLATINTASEFGFGGVIAALPGFTVVQNAISGTFTNPLVNGAVTSSFLSGMMGSASGGMSILLGVMGDKYMEAITAFNIPPEVMHRVISMAAGGMDTLPHNGAVITLLAVAGLTHRQAYKGIFAVTVIKTAAAFFIIGVYSLTGLV